MGDDIYNFLVQMGYSPTEQGEYYRCCAIYRGGDNPTALSISKKTGKWCDFPQGIRSAPFEKLIKLTLGESQDDFLKKYLDSESFSTPQSLFIKDDYMKNDIFPPSILNNLLNLYTFYEKRGISKETQSAYLAGYASSGKMYGRMVFPIYDEIRQLIGFAGRDVYGRENKNVPKWKIIGKKKNFVYPFFIPEMENKFMSSFNEEREVILVESIGDSMALYQNGIFNNLVSFGLSGCDSLYATLNRLNPDIITISFNNDKKSPINRGLIGSIKSFLALSSIFSIDKLRIKLPLCNDFGDMVLSSDKNIFDKWINKEIEPDMQREYMKNIIFNGSPDLFTIKEIKQAKSIL